MILYKWLTGKIAKSIQNQTTQKYKYWTYLLPLIFCLFAIGESANAQIKGDGTLPTKIEKSGNVIEITGGKSLGKNLFHSFAEFSVDENQTASFQNSSDVANIIGRITGILPSNINGILQANGNANLILINPNGINFGSNTRLNIGGSFLGSTADRIEFADGNVFSALASEGEPILTLSVPIGLQFGKNPAAINLQGRGNNLSLQNLDFFQPIVRGKSEGLEVRSKETIALIGGDINLNGGVIKALDGGRIQLGSVDEGKVGLNFVPNGWSFDYAKVSNFRDINLSRSALIDASGFNGGSIDLQGDRVLLDGGSTILQQTSNSTADNNININAVSSLNVLNAKPDGSFGSTVATEVIGNNSRGGNIRVTSKQLNIQNGGQIYTTTFTNSRGGDIDINASQSIEIAGINALNPFSTRLPGLISLIGALSVRSGVAGDLNISTGQLTTSSGGRIFSSTFFGSGKGGNLNINATESIALLGIDPVFDQPSVLTTSSLGSGDAGNLTIDTDRLTIEGGAFIGSSTFGEGAAGNTTINATESIELSGKGRRNYPFPSQISSGSLFNSQQFRDFFRLPPEPNGQAGFVKITTGKLTIDRSAFIDVKSEGLGNAGQLTIDAESIAIDDNSSISASTKNGNGGNIKLQIEDSIILRRNGRISAQTTGGGTGGDIRIDARNIALLENSRIDADALIGKGGNISVNSRGLFSRSDRISASSTLGIDGTIEIVTPDIFKNIGITDLSLKLANPEEVVALSCQSDRSRRESQFTLAGRGGLPPIPTAPLESESLVGFNSNLANSSVTDKHTQNLSIPPPAQSWYVNPQGAIILSDRTDNPVPHDSVINSPQCQ